MQAHLDFDPCHLAASVAQLCLAGSGHSSQNRSCSLGVGEAGHRPRAPNELRRYLSAPSELFHFERGSHKKSAPGRKEAKAGTDDTPGNTKCTAGMVVPEYGGLEDMENKVVPGYGGRQVRRVQSNLGTKVPRRCRT